MITEEHIKEGLSRAYALAIGHNAGMNCSLGFEFDYKLDGCYREVETLPDGTRSDSGFQIDFQLKASKNVEVRDREIVYDLDVRNYNHLSKTKVGIPRILILLKLPENPEEWLHVCEENTILRNCAWWCDLKGMANSNNSETRRIYIPRKQILTPDTLIQLMNRVSEGDDLSA
ncbi:MAG: hypothetical protein CVU95_15560 [Firmicutes bacterium HGW-Firmicutes-2]|nr:MAG: hypothetical protein CVU95_15560 [Firmicutes bacterium HGW-Firmicutes-2]